MTGTIRNDFSSGPLFAAFVATLVLLPAVEAQTAQYELSLFDARVEVGALSDSSNPPRSDEVTFLVEASASTVVIQLISNVEGVESEMDYPGGQAPITPLNVDQIGGTYRNSHLDDEAADLCHLAPTYCFAGYWHQYSFPSQGPGVYTVRFSIDALPPGDTDAPVIVLLDAESPLGATLFTTPDRVKNGDSATLTAIVVDDDQPETGATVTARVSPPETDDYGDPVTLLDNGQPPDTEANDGMYTAAYSPPGAPPLNGEYGVYGEIIGASGSFKRQVGTTFEVYEPEAEFSTTSLDLRDEGVDDDANSLFDRVVVSAKVDVATTGTYSLAAVMQLDTETSIVGRSRQVLSAGSGVTIEAQFYALEFLREDLWGSYTIDRLELVYFDETPDEKEARVVDTVYLNPVHTTANYQRVQFERPAIEIRDGEITSTAVDTSGNSLYDELRFTIPMDLLYSGTYQYAASLHGPCGDDVFAPIDSVGGELVVDAPVSNPVDLVVTFSGGRIGASGMDGPYSLRDLTIVGPAFTTAWVLADSGTYAATEFEDYAPADCNTDGTTDLCDVALDPTADCDLNGVPDDCPGETPVTGRCCHDETGACTDGVSICECLGVFEGGATCAESFPACEFACCTPDGQCDLGRAEDCQSEGGVLTFGSTCGQVGCFTACFASDNCCFDAADDLGCNDAALCNAVCKADLFCCDPGNTWDDVCKTRAVNIATGLGQVPSDCDGNEEYDVCEIQEFPSKDYNGNGVLDICDAFDDCNEDGVPDDCQAGACCDDVTGECIDGVLPCDCIGNHSVAVTCATVTPPCEFACCQPAGTCANSAVASCSGVAAPGSLCEDGGFACPVTEEAEGCCFAGNGSPGCNDPLCSLAVCLRDDFCCDTVWDSLCAQEAYELCPAPGAPAAPLAAPYPHDRVKNRYISFAPDNTTDECRNVAFKIELKSVYQGSCNGAESAPCRYAQGAGQNEPGNADCRRCADGPNSGQPCINGPIECVSFPCNQAPETCSNDDPANGATNLGGAVVRWAGTPSGSTIYRMVASGDPANDTNVTKQAGNAWPDVVHIGDCEIVPQASYGIRAVDLDTGAESEELIVSTLPRPAHGVYAWWADTASWKAKYCNNGLPSGTTCVTDADCGGAPGSCVLGWGLPNGFTNVDDTLAALSVFDAFGPNPVNPIGPGTMATPQVADITWIDMHDVVPNRVSNAADVQQIGLAFRGLPYPFLDPADCPDTAPSAPEGGDSMPEGGIMGGEMDGPLTSGGLTIVPSTDLIQADETVDVEVFTDTVENLGAYQVSVDVTGGSAGSLDLEAVTIETGRADFVFASASVTRGTSVNGASLMAVLTNPGGWVFEGPAYLGTFTYRASADAAGVFTVSLRPEPASFLNDASGALIESSTEGTALVGCGVECMTDGHCDDADECTVDTCVANVCTFNPGPAGVTCDDGKFCTVGEECDGYGACAGGTSPCQPGEKCCELWNDCRTGSCALPPQ